MSEPVIKVRSASGLLCLIAFALFLLAAFGVQIGGVSLGWMGLALLAGAFLVP